MSQYIVEQSVKVKAEPAKVWRALTQPEQTKKYFFNCEVISDWTEGSDIMFKGKMLWVFPIEMHGTVVKYEPEKLLQYTLKNGKDGGLKAGFSLVTDQLTYENGETILTIKDDVGSSEGAEKRFQRSQKGWKKILTGLKKFVEEEQ